MRRIPLALASLSAVAVAASLVAVPAAQAAPAPMAPSVSLKGTTIERSLFGMHVFNLQDGVFPTVPVGVDPPVGQPDDLVVDRDRAGRRSTGPSSTPPSTPLGATG